MKLLQIPVCPFSQRLHILLTLKGEGDALPTEVVDITKPRDPEFLAKTNGSTALPVLEVEGKGILRESLVLMEFLDAVVGEKKIARDDPFEHGVENLMIQAYGSPLAGAGYGMVLNQDEAKRGQCEEKLLGVYKGLNDFLTQHNPDGTFLFDEFGYAEAAFTPLFQRFWFLEYYDGFAIPESEDFARFKTWHDACVSHPSAQQTSKEEIVKLYYDYALGCGNGRLPEGRSVSSFAFEPHWSTRPYPPPTKYASSPVSDADLGLL